ncbi:hypothetical protein PG996_016049 [Apiospora saccharicola]|uniref:Uncharacterized protein n=1 Tax=Apiospora saccharicola TaxID=335842 RepID=A0ABR1TMV2_9PEZI
MDHLVTDFSGPRYFVIGTNHKSVRRHAVRKMRQEEPLEEMASSPRPRTHPDPFAPADYSSSIGNDDDTAFEGEVDPNSLAEGFPIETPCVNPGCDCHGPTYGGLCIWPVHRVEYIDTLHTCRRLERTFPLQRNNTSEYRPLQ